MDTNVQWLVGNIVDDAQVRAVGDDKTVANLRVATNSEFGEKKTTDYHNVVIWGAGAEEAAVKARKGVRIAVEGRTRHRSYEKDGEKKWVTEVMADKVRYLTPEPAEELDQLKF